MADGDGMLSTPQDVLLEVRNHLAWLRRMGLEAVGKGGLNLVAEELGRCRRCKLSSTRTHLVFGEGDPAAEFVLVGEAPGRQEDLTGRPFVGPAGKLLDRMLKAMGMDRNQVYICNVLKCRPPNNRDPEPDEVAACEPFLWKQLDTIAPKVILALGAFASRTLLGLDWPMYKMRGKVHAAMKGDAGVVATYHPSYLLRNPEAKAEAWKDLKLALAELERRKSP